MNKISKNLKDTERIAKDFLVNLKGLKDRAVIVGLYGDLGAGKTAFTKKIAKILDIKRNVNSPTFVIMKRYPIPKKKIYKNLSTNKKNLVITDKNFNKIFAFSHLFHLDVYRLKNEKDLFHLGWEEIINNPENLIFIEWPEQIIKALPKKHHKILISHTKEGYRKFKILKA